MPRGLRTAGGKRESRTTLLIGLAAREKHELLFFCDASGTKSELQYCSWANILEQFMPPGGNGDALRRRADFRQNVGSAPAQRVLVGADLLVRDGGIAWLRDCDLWPEHGHESTESHSVLQAVMHAALWIDIQASHLLNPLQNLSRRGT